MKIRPSKSLVSLCLSSVVATSSILTTASLLFPKPVVAAGYCQCVAYIENRYGISIPANAKDAGPFLARNGFTPGGPQVGAIAIMQPKFPGADRLYGHIGVVQSLQNGRMTLRAANQTGGTAQVTEDNCTDVSSVTYGTSVIGNPYVSFWVKNNTTLPPSTGLGNFSQTCRNVSLSGSNLNASCERVNRTYTNTSINLNPYIGNINGQLKWNGQNFIQTCRNTTLVGNQILSAECEGANRVFFNTQINLDDYIANINGILKFK